MKEIVLDVKDLSMSFFTDQGVLPAVNHISFQVEKGKTLGIVGESGCGKSMTSLCVMRLFPSPPGKIVGIPMPEKIYKECPHQLSGGMRQRIMIAMALSCRPSVLICDEPTTALDVTVQAQILDLINRLKKETGTSVMMITHDMGVINEMSDTVLVMYAGQVVEYAPTEELFAHPSHPYTTGLMASIPALDREEEELNVIPGSVPMLYELPEGCLFEPRCPYATEQCRACRPDLTEIAPEHQVRCFRYTKEWKGEQP